MMNIKMKNPAHPGAIVRDAIEETGATISQAAARLGVARNTLSRLVNGQQGISAAMAIALEDMGWSNAEYWMRLQAAYDLAQARLRQAAA